MNNSIIEYSYNGSNISFDTKNGKVMVNATEMAKPFGNEKRPQFWLCCKYAQEYMDSLSKARNLALADLVVVTKGGNNPGTWMHEDVALEFARWLSPTFAIWCNDKIKELLQTGVAKISNTVPSYMIEDEIERAKQWIKEKEHQRLLENKVTEMQPKADYFDGLVDRNLLTNFRDTAKQLHIGQKELITLLIRDKYVYRDAKNKLKPYQQYVPEIFEIKDFERGGFVDKQTLITPKGKETFRLLYTV